MDNYYNEYYVTQNKLRRLQQEFNTLLEERNTLVVLLKNEYDNKTLKEQGSKDE